MKISEVKGLIFFIRTKIRLIEITWSLRRAGRADEGIREERNNMFNILYLKQRSGADHERVTTTQIYYSTTIWAYVAEFDSISVRIFSTAVRPQPSIPQCP